jgi:predicted Fe-Mo cluster-binding NifX family protein
MRICIPTGDDTGLDSPVHSGFGDAPWTTLVDPDAGTVLSVPNEACAHEEGRPAGGACATARELDLRPGDAVMCRTLGSRAFRTLAERGILVFRTTGPCVADAIEAVREGSVRPLREDEVTCGHGHSHGHGHGHHHHHHGSGGSACSA